MQSSIQPPKEYKVTELKEVTASTSSTPLHLAETIRKLAQDNEEKAVNALIKDHPNLKKHAATGFIQMNHRESLFRLLKSTELNLEPLIKSIAEDFVARKHTAPIIFQFLKEIIVLGWKYTHYAPRQIGLAFILNRDIAEFDELLTLCKTDQNTRPILSEMLFFIAKNIVQPQYTEKGLAFLNSVNFKYPKAFKRVFQEMLYAFAFLGKTEIVYQLHSVEMKEHNAHIHPVKVLEKMILGYMSGQHLNAAFTALNFVAKTFDRNAMLYKMAYSAGKNFTAETFNQFIDLVETTYPNHIQTVLDEMARGLIDSRNKNAILLFLDKIFEQYPTELGTIVRKLFVSEASYFEEHENFKLVMDKEVIIKAFTLVPDSHDLFSYLRNYMNSFSNSQLSDFQETINQFRQLMRDHKLSYNQAINWIKPEVQRFLLEKNAFFLFTEKLPKVIRNSIVTFISTMTLRETNQLVINMEIDKEQSIQSLNKSLKH